MQKIINYKQITLTVLLIAEFAGTTLKAQMLADFESPATSPGFYAEGSTDIVDNPDTLGINTSKNVGYYNKISGNWHYVSLQFPDTIYIKNNNTLTFKLRTSTEGRIFAKFYCGSEVVIENWCPNWNFKPTPYNWVECTMDMTEAMNKKFTLLQLAACVDNNAEADVWFDDVKLSNPEVGDGSPKVLFNVSETKVTTNDTITLDASDSYDYDGSIVDYQWDFDDGTTGSGKITTHTFAADSVYRVSLTVTDNEGKSSTSSRYIFVTPVDGKISAPRIETTSPLTNRKIEAMFHLTGVYDNPYDPDEIMVDAVIKYPGGDSSVVPCFYYTDVNYVKKEWTEDPGYQCWKVRFTSEQSGTHSICLKLKDTSGISYSDTYTFNVAQSTARGIVRTDSVNKQYFRHSTGEPFYPLGINIGWNSIENYTRIINNLFVGGANIFRYWHAAFAIQSLEWDEDYWRPYPGLGRYDQEAAAKHDSLLRLCESRNVYMQLSIFSHGMFSETVDEMWESNPYNSANGGYVDQSEEFFYDDDCKAQVKKLLRYIIARWSYSTKLFAWEFFNEVQFTGNHPNQSGAWFRGVQEWHSEMSRYVDSIDPYDHLQTTSAAGDQIPVFDTISTLDNMQYHLYTGETTLLEEQAHLDYHFRNELQNVSVINGEYGAGDADVPFDIQRHAIWNGIMTQVPRYMWMWDHYVQMSWAKLFTMPAQYLAGEDFAVEESLQKYQVALTHPEKELNSYGLTSGNEYFGYIYDPNNGSNITGAKVLFPDLPLANYDLTWYLPVADEITVSDSIAPYFSSNEQALPQFSKGIAFKLKYRSDYTAPIAGAGKDTVIVSGGTASLSGESSYAHDSGPLTYLWRIIEKPASSMLVLENSTGMIIEVTPDVAGIYSFQLIVNDGTLDSRPDKVTVRVSTPPVANAGRDTTLVPEQTYLRISGKLSYDPDGETITYQWILLSAPPESDSILLGGQESGITSLKMDAEGVYIIQLTVFDGYQNSLPDTVIVTVLGTGIEGISSTGPINVFPNPTTGRVYITLPGHETLEGMEVFDMQGRKLLHIKSPVRANGLYEIDLGKHPDISGPVLIKITGSENTVFKVLYECR